MPLLGAHMSIAGGYYKAVEAAANFGMDVVQVFTKNNNQWRAKPITDDESRLFHERLKELRIASPVSHASYLINLASPDPALWKKSIEAMVVELQRAEQLGIPCVVVHPGSHTIGTERAGLKQVIRAVDESLSQTGGSATALLLENTAGQGTNLGWQFEHLATILAGVQTPERVGICFDTCHAFAAGYPLGTEREYRATMRRFDQLVGVKRIKAFHVNDSKREFGSRVDRHAHIGAGCLGLEPFRWLLNDRRFRKVPMYLETPKEKHPETGEEWDAVNLRTLRSLVR